MKGPVGGHSENGMWRKLRSTKMAYVNGRNEGQAFGGVDFRALRNAIRNVRRHPALRSVMLGEYHWEIVRWRPFTFSVLEHSGTKRQLEEDGAHQLRAILVRRADYPAGERGVDITRWQHRIRI